MPEKFIKMKKSCDENPSDVPPDGAAKIIHDGDKIIYDYSHLMNQEGKLIHMKKTVDILNEKDARREEKEERKREHLAMESGTSAMSSDPERGKLYKSFVSAVDGFFALFGLKSEDYENRKAEKKLSKQARRADRSSRREKSVTQQIMEEQRANERTGEKEVDENERSM